MKVLNRIKSRGQEEMVGFALIIIIVSVIILILLGFSLNKNGQNIKSYEAQSFIESALQYTTTCQNNFGNVQVIDLITMCMQGPPGQGQTCNDGESSCTVLNSTLSGILSTSWPVAQGSVVKGYYLDINTTSGDIVNIKVGNTTGSSQGTIQDFSPGGSQIQVMFTTYY